MKVLVLHAYSGTNAGDGLLVHETIRLLHEAFGPRVDVTIAALHPHTFEGTDAQVLDARIAARGYPRELRAALRGIDEFDLVVGVGGGYLRAGRVGEMLKTALAHGNQLRAAARRTGPVVYLSQSIGPLRFGLRAPFRRALRGIDAIHARDDRSVVEVNLPNVRRTPDLALLAPGWAARPAVLPEPVPVLTVRHIRGKLPIDVIALCSILGPYDGYVQSTGAGNDDRRAVEESSPRRLLTRTEFLGADSERRVVVAVRLHAALMAMRAGHWVVHLAYERKGFGAFADLDLREYAHNVNDFSADLVKAQIKALLEDPEARARYDLSVSGAISRFDAERKVLVASLGALVPSEI